MTAEDLENLSIAAVKGIPVHPGWIPDPHNPHMDGDDDETLATHDWTESHGVRISAVLNMENDSDRAVFYFTFVNYYVCDDDITHMPLSDCDYERFRESLAEWLGNPPERALVRIAMAEAV